MASTFLLAPELTMVTTVMLSHLVMTVLLCQNLPHVAIATTIGRSFFAVIP